MPITYVIRSFGSTLIIVTAPYTATGQGRDNIAVATRRDNKAVAFCRDNSASTKVRQN